MKIVFQTKQESNQQQLESFLALSGAERLYSFLRLSKRISNFPVKKQEKQKTKNFVINIELTENANLGK
jgi:hypothetical protein